jgi:hypothetical protein
MIKAEKKIGPPAPVFETKEARLLHAVKLARDIFISNNMPGCANLMTDALED